MQSTIDNKTKCLSMYKKGQLRFKSTMLCFKPQLHSSEIPGQEYRIFIFIIFFLRKFKFGQQWGLKAPWPSSWGAAGDASFQRELLHCGCDFGIHQNGYNLITRNWHFKDHGSPFG